MKDKLHILLSLPNFVSVLFTVLSHEDDKERVRQLNELRTVTEIILRRDKCFKCMTDEYYGNSMLPVPEDCGGCCPKCRGEKSRVVKRSFLVDHMEASVFDNGPVNVGPLSAKILERKGSVWIDKAVKISAADCHELIMLMWVHRIVVIHWTDKGKKKM